MEAPKKYLENDVLTKTHVNQPNWFQSMEWTYYRLKYGVYLHYTYINIYAKDPHQCVPQFHFSTNIV